MRKLPSGFVRFLRRRCLKFFPYRYKNSSSAKYRSINRCVSPSSIAICVVSKIIRDVGSRERLLLVCARNVRVLKINLSFCLYACTIQCRRLGMDRTPSSEDIRAKPRVVRVDGSLLCSGPPRVVEPSRCWYQTFNVFGSDLTVDLFIEPIVLR